MRTCAIIIIAKLESVIKFQVVREAQNGTSSCQCSNTAPSIHPGIHIWQCGRVDGGPSRGWEHIAIDDAVEGKVWEIHSFCIKHYVNKLKWFIKSRQRLAINKNTLGRVLSHHELDGFFNLYIESKLGNIYGRECVCDEKPLTWLKIRMKHFIVLSKIGRL